MLSTSHSTPFYSNRHFKNPDHEIEMENALGEQDQADTTSADIQGGGEDTGFSGDMEGVQQHNSGVCLFLLLFLKTNTE
jgi:hypothetical protein